MSLHDAIGEAVESMEAYLADGDIPSPDVEALIVRMQVYEFFHWFSPSEHKALWDACAELITGPYSTEEVKARFLVAAQGIAKEHDKHFSWDGWRMVGADIREDLLYGPDSDGPIGKWGKIRIARIPTEYLTPEDTEALASAKTDSERKAAMDAALRHTPEWASDVAKAAKK